MSNKIALPIPYLIVYLYIFLVTLKIKGQNNCLPKMYFRQYCITRKIYVQGVCLWTKDLDPQYNFKLYIFTILSTLIFYILSRVAEIGKYELKHSFAAICQQTVPIHPNLKVLCSVANPVFWVTRIRIREETGSESTFLDI